jgi:uncharacterized protein (TIGR02118 family)
VHRRPKVPIRYQELKATEEEMGLFGDELHTVPAMFLAHLGLRADAKLRPSKRGAQVVKVSVLYPNHTDTRFDMAYYLEHHIPLVQRLLGSALKGVYVEQGLSGANLGSRASYVALGHLVFDSVESYQTSFGPHADVIVGDIPNYTNSEPTIQISEVKL